jgi:uncharacterized protein YxjI
MRAGADMAAVSMHKSGGSLTQSSLLLIGENVNERHVRQIINLTQTTSGSYLLMSSLDISRRNLALRGKEVFRKVVEMAEYAREEINAVGGYYAYGRELISIRHGSKAALVTMMFDVYRDGALIGHVNQKVEKARYVYDFPELGFFNESDTYACNLNISKNGYPAATAVKKKKSMTDKYTVTVNDSRDADVVLALIMIVQLSLMRSRRGNSRI